MIIAKIHNRYKELTAAEQKVGAYILSFSCDVPHMTVKELAEKCGVAQSAVIRFCKTMGYSGFSKLKIALAGEISGIKTDKIPAFDKKDDTKTVFEKVFASGISTLSDTLKMLDFASAEKAAKLFFKCEKNFHFRHRYIFACCS